MKKYGHNIFAILFICFSIFCLSSFYTIRNISDSRQIAAKQDDENKRCQYYVDSIVKLLTLDEKIALIHGSGTFESGGVERLGIPGLYYTDGPNGIREELEKNSWKPLQLNSDSATFFPTGTALAATWNPLLALRYGEAIGMEARARGKDILLGPAVNIIRTPVCGRNFEYFTEDPFLNSVQSVAYVQGVQRQDVAACVKHFAANNQEFERGRINVTMSERALREIYLPVFKACTEKANVLSMMGAYNKFRGDYLCENNYLNTTILKQEFGFRGIIISDWGATHNTIKAAMGGLDVEMGTRGDPQQNFMAAPLRDSVLSGKVPIEVIDDKVRRILRVIYSLKKVQGTRSAGAFTTPEISKTAYDVASESIVLLKNTNQLLPLDTKQTNSIAVIGQNAVQPQSFGGATASVKAKYEVSPLKALQNKVGKTVQLNYAQGYTPTYRKESNSWYGLPENTPDSALIAEAVKVALESDIAIIFAGTNRWVESEAHDRKNIELPFGQDELIKAVTKANPATIVVIIAGAACDLNTASANTPALLFAWYNGSEAGNALADVLFGTVNPSGKLPFTIPVNLNDVGAHALNAYPGENLEVNYKEDILVGYRWFDTKQIHPLYPFGFGLSYTTFEYQTANTDKTKYYPGDTILVNVSVRNSGNFKGKEVIQCYVHCDNPEVLMPEKELKAFVKTELAPNENKTVLLKIPVNDLAYYCEAKKQWLVSKGKYHLLVGGSSRNIRLTTAILVN